MPDNPSAGFSSDRERTLEIINDKAKGVCPRCQNAHFALAEGYFNFAISDSPTKINLQGACVPCVAAICTRCGFVAFHAVGALGLLPTQTASPAEEGAK